VGCEAETASWATGEKAGLRGGFGPEAVKEKEGKRNPFANFKRAHKT
jgi:hypothetical protein